MATQPTDQASHLPGELADAFGRAGKSVVRAFDERLGEHGVSTPRSKLLAEIQRLGPVRLADLARAVGVTQGTASTLVEALVRDHLVERSTDANDRRAIRLSVTQSGDEQARRWLTDYLDAARDIFACLDPAEQRVLARLLTHLADTLESAPGQ
ncbi:MarR family transcriptional regulator [Mycobacterium gordonae]|uniref:MarR family transcriptional regulator n=1 Tax=Mycobacterium gordonae TaxID=1778 RepID=A0A0Q2XGX0_MYCGO|nr:MULTISPECIES: MarR family winged helix-turn-helix transcriptional regulator [Mycobacterium]KQH80460.1 MarR family transcriptional regulator [Mycobacterium gordonae]MDP7727910.1 MarR family winged helix-turn-helix transcriptional regulator [Mycobacterium sp. TY813]